LKFTELQKLFHKQYDTDRSADIAHEFNVTPQVVHNWKTRDIVPYKYVKKLKRKIKESKKNKKSIDLSNNPIILQQTPSQFQLDESQLDLKQLLKNIISTCFENKKLISLYTFIILTICLTKIYFFTFDYYTSDAKIIPAVGGSKSANQLTGIASQFGVNLPTSSSSSSQISGILYPEIIRSRTITNSILENKFFIEKLNKSVPLYDFLIGGEISKPVKLELAGNILKNMINLNMDELSRLIKIEVVAPEASLAHAISNSIIEKLNESQIAFKSSRIKEKKTFIKNRLDDSQKELYELEEGLKTFLDKNRNIQSSPALMLELNRQEREVEMQMQIFTTLKREFELAQIEEVEKSNMIIVLDPPNIPNEKSGPRRRLLSLFSIIFSIILSTILVFSTIFIKKYKKRILNFIN
tara:strand:+ start:600 stop:1832 length:1233 start_codon:yes stop_codon:yes gene_type:complete